MFTFVFGVMLWYRVDSCFAVDGLMFCSHGDTRMGDFLDCTIFFMFLFCFEFIDLLVRKDTISFVAFGIGTWYYILGIWFWSSTMW